MSGEIGRQASVSECSDQAARLVARNPGAAQRLLAAHPPDRRGRCSGCGHKPPQWPCALVAVAERARELLAGSVEISLKVVMSAPGKVVTRRP
ncbi:MAG: hypothetical protein H7Y15_00785 [Pseudonocardia sp.]|nr:hypothetical protein [Pseudonocardia sp.]